VFCDDDEVLLHACSSVGVGKSAAVPTLDPKCRSLQVATAMRTFRCACGARLFFENFRCLTCGHELGFLPDALELVALQPTDSGWFSTPHGEYAKCSNYVDEGVCTWMVPKGRGSFCQACRLNNVIPDLSQFENRSLWAEVERSKRRLVYTLNRLRLPVQPKSEDPDRGLSFDIKAPVDAGGVLTGHADGLVTLNLKEASPVERERMRMAMKERYRTLLGHFRHEIGHYYWDRLVRDSPRIGAFRALFGDERLDYAEALKRHYANAHEAEDPAFVSPYAAAHPWEDFAETFAHYLHMSDSLETAADFGFGNAAAGGPTEFDSLMTQWIELSVALNALNRSMGLPDAYPFTISSSVSDKIRFVHDLVSEQQPIAK
jgi:hypothetical protein